jgi:DNA-binding NarL/FixJ family response regulator
MPAPEDARRITTMTINKARILIVDDHPLVREWLGQLISRSPDLAICAEAEDPADALRLIAESQPDLAIIDLSLRSHSGIELIEQIRSSFPKVGMIVLSMHDEQVYAERCIRAGARGYIMKRETTKNIVEAIHEVLNGNVYLSKGMLTQIVEKVVSSDAPNFAGGIAQLSDRELEVFKLLGQGFQVNEVAKKLELGAKTAELVREAQRRTGSIP